jgi:6-pyruvoyltetrahydropterin/6-carboxytetrahydropterin synthase
MRASVTRTVRFTASHRYWKPEWTEEENRARFGKLTHAHPHEYTCAVTISGQISPRTSGIVNLADLDRILDEEVRQRLDGQAIHDLPEFAGGKQLPTCEAIASDVFARIAARIPADVTLESVRVAESDSLSATVTRE